MGNKQDRDSSDPVGSQAESSQHANKFKESASFNQQPPPSRLPQSSDINRGPSSTSSSVRSTNGNLLLPGGCSQINNNIRVEPSAHQQLPSRLSQSSTISRNSSSGSSIAKNSSQNRHLLVTAAQSSMIQRNNGAGAIPKSLMVSTGTVRSSGAHSGNQPAINQLQQSGRAVQKTSNLSHHLVNQNVRSLLDTKVQSSLAQRTNDGTASIPKSQGSIGGRDSGAYSGYQPNYKQQHSGRVAQGFLPANQSIYQKQDTGRGRAETHSDNQFNFQQQESSRSRGAYSGNHQSNHNQQQRGRGRASHSGNQTNPRQQQSSRGRGAQSGNQDRNNQQQNSGKGQNQNSASSRDHHESNENGQRRQFKKYPLNFTLLKKLAEENTEPSELVKKFTDEEYGLQTLLRDNSTNWEFVELILVALGGFCEQGGNSQFSSAFSKIITILRDNQVFQNVFTVFLQIPHSRSDKLGSKEKRLVQLVESISYLATEMLTQIPALACDVLGENFFGDLVNLKTTPSIRGIDQTNVFETLQEVTIRLKNAW